MVRMRQAAVGVAVAVLVGACSRPASGPPTGIPQVSPSPTVGLTASELPSPEASRDAGTVPERDVKVWFGSVFDSWYVSDPMGGHTWRLPLGERPVDAQGRQLLTVSSDKPGASTIRIYDLDGPTVVLRHPASPSVSRASFLADRVIFAPGPKDNGVWSLAPSRRDPTQVVKPKAPVADPRFGRSWMTASPSHRTVISQIPLDGGRHDVDVITANGQARHSVPDGLSVTALTDDVLVAQGADAIAGISVGDGSELWRLPYGAVRHGVYATSDGKRIVVARFDPEHSGALQLVSIDPASGNEQQLISWPTGDDQPIFWQELSGDQVAVFAPLELEAWLADGGKSVVVTTVDLADGTTAERTLALPAPEDIR